MIYMYNSIAVRTTDDVMNIKIQTLATNNKFINQKKIIMLYQYIMHIYNQLFIIYVDLNVFEMST